MLASVFANPVLAITEQEASQVSQAIAKVARHYGTIKASAEALDWANLAMALTIVYGTRVMVLKQAQKKEAESKPPQQPYWQPTIVNAE